MTEETIEGSGVQVLAPPEVEMPGLQIAQATPFDHILEKMASLGHFRAVVLASTGGLPIATASPSGQPDVTAAMVALLQGVSRETREQLGLPDLDEVTIVARDRTRLVCRYFTIGDEDLILAVIVEPNGYYRSATAWAMREIDALWNRSKRRKNRF